ncbi:MAG: hypothetical protein Q8R55_03555 [Candidatus Taylorbacteria bacterium]|nr:hypothetical protein [Candidatus Taylorbacteria bacterium]
MPSLLGHLAKEFNTKLFKDVLEFEVLHVGLGQTGTFVSARIRSLAGSTKERAIANCFDWIEKRYGLILTFSVQDLKPAEFSPDDRWSEIRISAKIIPIKPSPLDAPTG